ncbi:MAG: hypothetical protein ACLRMS_08995 [Streptococcus thermophilus]
MKKNFLTKVMTLALAATMVLTPVTASAAEKTVVTSKEYHSVRVDCYDEETEVFDGNRLYDYVASLNGCYQPNGYKIYTALDNKTITFKKTGNYAVIVGGKTAKKDQGSFKFVAPKTGTYKFTFSTKNNVAGGQIFIKQSGNARELCFFKVNYKAGSEKLTKDTSVLVTDDPKWPAYATKGGNVLSHYIDDKTSSMTKVSGSIKLKKGQFVKYVARDSGAGYDERDDAAYNFTGFDVSITKTK